jgi:excisionase family DNA binding protein
MTEQKDKILTLEQAANLLNLKVSRLRYEVFKKTIPFLKIGRNIRFSESDLISWLMEKKQGGSI